MIEKDDSVYSQILDTYDELKLNTFYERRIACKPLYDYFQKLTLEIGAEQCYLNRSSLGQTHLKHRWERIKNCLVYIENPEKWNDIINKIAKIRDRVEHEDDYAPDQKDLEDIRKRVPKFKDWITNTAEEFYKKSKNFTFKEAFYLLSNHYITEAESIFEKYGDNPYVAKSDYLEIEGVDIGYPYQKLPELVKTLTDGLKNIARLEDIERSDLERLIQIVKIISHFKGKEEILLRFSFCPKCGGKLKETEEYLGGTEDEPEPDEAYIRFGCEKCDYLVHDEKIAL